MTDKPRYLYVVELRKDYLATERCVFMTRAEAYAWAEARMALREVIPQANGDEHWLGQIVGDGAVLMRVPSEVKVWSEVKHMMGDDDEFEVLGVEDKEQS